METIYVSINVLMYKENVAYIHNRILFSHEKEGNPAICDKHEWTIWALC